MGQDTTCQRRLARRGQVILVIGAVLTSSAAADHIAAGTPSRQQSENRFSSARPAAPTAFATVTEYRNPSDPGAKPTPVRRIVTRLHRGTKIDTSVPARCKASAAELHLRGERACPARSRVGGGKVVIDTGVSGPLRFQTVDVTRFNTNDGFIVLAKPEGSGLVVSVSRAQIRGRTITEETPAAPGSPPDGGAVKSVDLRLERITRRHAKRKRSYLTTPSRCPARGGWTNRSKFTYADGVTQVVRTVSGCRDAAPRRSLGRFTRRR